MLKLIDKLFKSDLVGESSILDILISFILVVTVWILSIMLYYYTLPINTESASEYFIYDKAELSFNESSREYIGYVNTYYSFSKEQPQIVIYTDDNRVLTSEVDERANDIFNEIGIGSAEYNNGVLIYVNINPDTKVRVEIGYGLEDVINDAKAGMIIDDNVKKISDKKPLKHFNREELSSLSLNIFKDINNIIKEKYNIKVPYRYDTSLIYNYENKDKHILILIIVSILLYIRCLKYRHTYIMVFIPFVFITILGYIINEVLYFISGITLFAGIIISSPAAFAVIFIITFLMMPFLDNILSFTTTTDKPIVDKRKKKQGNQGNQDNKDNQVSQTYKRNNSNNEEENIHKDSTGIMPNAKALLKGIFIPPKNKSYFKNLPHRFLLNYVVIFLSVYIFIFYIIDKYGYIFPVILLIIATLVISIFLFIKIKSYRVPLTYALYMSAIFAYVLDFNIVYDDFIHISAVFIFICNMMVGFGPTKVGRSGRGGFIAGRSSGRSGGFSSGRRGGSFRGGGRSGGGGARR